MRDAAAEGAARANGIVRDVTHHRGEKPTQRPVRHGMVEGGVAHAGADAKPLALDGEAPQRLDPIDVDQMCRARQAKRHDRHQALAAGEHAPVLARNLGKGLDRLFDRLGRVISERRGLHRCSPRIRWRSKHGRTITADCPIFGKLIFFGLMHSCWCM